MYFRYPFTYPDRDQSRFGFRQLFDRSIDREPDNYSKLSEYDDAGSGFISKSAYRHGFFGASIKLPADYTAGVVVAFYVRAPA